MKRLIQSIALLLAVCMLPATEAFSQDDFRSGAPEPGPARKVEIGTYETFELDNGLKVIVVENHKRPRVAYRLFIDWDPIVEGDLAGYTYITGDLLKRGTKTRTKAEIDESIDFVGGSLSTSSSGGFASSLTKHTEKVLELFADVILNPSFPIDEFDKIKTQTVSGLQAQKDDPNAISTNVSNALIYGLDHPYGEMMTEVTLENIGVEQCIEFYKTYFKPDIAYMVVVGDIKPKAARNLVEKYFGQWQTGDVPTHEYEMPELPVATRVDFVDKPGAVQSVIDITYPVDLAPGDDDVIPARVMNTILGSGFSGRLFKNLREDKAYTYGAYSSLSSDELVGSFSANASVRNEVTDSAVVEFLYELNQMATTDVSDDELELAKNYIAGAFARNLESAQTVANFALNTFRYNLPEDYYATYLEKLEKVDKAAVRAMAEKYITPDNARIVVVGNEGQVADKLIPFDQENGEITFYDIYANERKPTVDAGDVTGEEVVNKYIESIGGEKTIMEISTIRQEMSTSMMGQDVNIVVQQMTPNKFAMEMSMPGMIIMRQVYDGESGYVEQMGQKTPMDEATLEEMKKEAQIVPEMSLLGDGYTLAVDGIEEVNGEMAYKLVATDAKEKSTIYYFGKDSGYKLKSITTQEAQGQTLTITNEYLDYKEVEGLVVPHTTKVSGMMPTPVEMKVMNVEVNTEIDPSVFQ